MTTLLHSRPKHSLIDHLILKNSHKKREKIPFDQWDDLCNGDLWLTKISNPEMARLHLLITGDNLILKLPNFHWGQLMKGVFNENSGKCS